MAQAWLSRQACARNQHGVVLLAILFGWCGTGLSLTGHYSGVLIDTHGTHRHFPCIGQHDTGGGEMCAAVFGNASGERMLMQTIQPSTVIICPGSKHHQHVGEDTLASCIECRLRLTPVFPVWVSHHTHHWRSTYSERRFEYN